MPLISFVSYFEPVATNTKIVVVSEFFIGARISRRPFGNVFFLNIIYQPSLFCKEGLGEIFYRVYFLVISIQKFFVMELIHLDFLITFLIKVLS